MYKIAKHFSLPESAAQHYLSNYTVQHPFLPRKGTHCTEFNITVTSTPCTAFFCPAFLPMGMVRHMLCGIILLQTVRSKSAPSQISSFVTYSPPYGLTDPPNIQPLTSKHPCLYAAYTSSPLIHDAKFTFSLTPIPAQNTPPQPHLHPNHIHLCNHPAHFLSAPKSHPRLDSPFTTSP
jgi:hypothetical protein